MTRDKKQKEKTGQLFRDYETLFTQAPDAYVVTDTDTRIIAANTAAALLFNSSGEALFQKTLISFLSRGERTPFHRRLKRLIKYQFIEDWEVSFKPPHRHSFNAAMTAKAVIHHENGFLLHWAIRNITERKMMEVHLSDHFGEYRRVNETLPDIIYATDRYGRVTFISGATRQLLGSPAENLIGNHILDLGGILNISPQLLARFTKEIELCIKRGGDTLEHTVNVEIEGKSRVFELKQTLRYDTVGNFCGLSGVMRDCTLRMDHDQHYGTMMEQSPLGIVIFQGMPVRIVFANSVIAKILGYSREDLQSLSAEGIATFIHPDDRDMLLKRYRDSSPGEPRMFPSEVRIRKKNGSWKWLEMIPNRIEYHKKPAVQATFIGVTDRKYPDLKVRALERISRTVLEDIHVGIYRTSPGPTDAFMFVNQSMANLLGYSACEDLLTQPVYEVYEDPEDRNRILARLQEEGTVRIEGVMLRRNDGSSFKSILSAHAIRGSDNGIIWIHGILEKMDHSVHVAPLPGHKGNSEPWSVLSSSIGS